MNLCDNIYLNPSPKDKILDVTKLKTFVDNKLIVISLKIFLFDRVENTWGTGENAGNQHFLLFRQCFQKSPLLWDH